MISNPAPLVATLNLSATPDALVFNHTPGTDLDYAGLIIAIKKAADPDIDLDRVFKGADVAITITKLADDAPIDQETTYHVSYAAYDAFGEEGIVWSTPTQITTPIRGAASTVWNDISGPGKPADNADVTAENTALGVINQGAFATLSQLTPSNIETFISALSVVSALIANASIDSAKIANAAIAEYHLGSGIIDSTHIKNAVIDTSHLKDAIIDSAKIGHLQVNSINIASSAISTDKIQSNAVSSAVSAFTAGNITLSPWSSWGTIQSCTINTAGTKLLILVQYISDKTDTADGGSIEARLTDNGTQIYSNTQPISREQTIMFSHTPASGSHTIAIQIRGVGDLLNVKATMRTMFVQELKK